MKYDFDFETQRINTDSLKWDDVDCKLPMWVADMDFKTPPQIINAIQNRLQSGVLGYTVVPDAWYSAIINWWQNRHRVTFKKEWLCFSTGVVPAITSIVKRVTNHGDNVLVQTPVYDIFFHSIENTGRKVFENKLLYSNGKYQIDFADLEKKLAHPLTTMMILCNPHNPVGKIWSRSQLEKISRLCSKYGVTLLSDEIHCDLTDPNAEYTPLLSVNKNCITCIAASKTFNIAGLQSAAVVIPDEFLRNKVVRGLNSDEVAEPNCFAALATATAFTECEDWLNQLRDYLFENKKIAYDFIGCNLPQIKVVKQNATYLLWIDCSAVTDNAQVLCDFLVQKTGLMLSCGSEYRGNGNAFLRMNIACPKSRLALGLKLFKKGIDMFVDQKGGL